MTITVSNTSITNDGQSTTLRAEVEGSRSHTLFFTVPTAFDDLLTDRIDPFAVAMLLPAMRHGHDLRLRGTITDELLFHLNHDVQQWVRSIMPMYSAVRVDATDAAPPEAAVAGVATGFSGGIDSFSLVDDYLLQEVPEHLRVTHLLYNHVGPVTPEAKAAFDIGFRNAQLRADAWSVPLVPVRTNIDDHFHGNNTAVANTISVRNAAVAHALAKGIGRWYHASSVSFPNIHARPNGHMEVSDAVSLPLLSTSGLTLSAVGSERSRVQKTLQVIRIPDAPAAINVCIDVREGRPTTNCSKCMKCVRTLTTLDIAGQLHLASAEAFDVSVYLRERDAELAKLLQGELSVDREVIAFAAERDWSFPPRARRLARSIRWRSRMWNTARSVKHSTVDVVRKRLEPASAPAKEATR